MYIGTSKANKNTDKESQAAFLMNWLGATGERLVKSHKLPKAEKENVDTILDKVKQDVTQEVMKHNKRTNFS